ncbi:hypothetical protein DFO66_10710 [Brevibacterium sanguinis]|uniref:Head-tail joining protein n=2 Tax=Brevibacterium TaxID=1696 RepID=A0A366IJV6_9MICO|nr:MULTISPECIES: hypothetical protein [Brevibacterium]RBP64138.1 hypothetical protein DFO66_10710 [Brevibacterium sanguinis]RBP71570.1 hypothetical protein DFO65_105174 [Brevibacterium celere]
MIGIHYTQTIQLVIATLVDVRGVPTPDWNNPTLIPVKSHVYYESTGLDDQGTSPGLVFTRQLTALMEPIEYDPRYTRIRWQGYDYTIDAPEVRFRYGKPIFQAVQLLGRAN